MEFINMFKPINAHFSTLFPAINTASFLYYTLRNIEYVRMHMNKDIYEEKKKLNLKPVSGPCKQL